MTFRTHPVGGSWTGGGSEINCCVVNQTAIRTAFAFMQGNGVRCLERLGGLDGLISCLRGKTEESVDLDCVQWCRNDAYAETSFVGSSSIAFCPGGLPPRALPQETDVTLFHECIHSCGGLEIDAWSFENHCYRGHGTLDPDANVRGMFLSQTTDVGGDLRAGTFVVWERITGRVFVKVSSGGSWNSGPTITRGAELNVDNFSYMR